MLQHAYRDLPALQSRDSVCSCPGGCNSCKSGDALGDGGATDRLLVEPGILALGSVDDELNPLPFNQIYDVRPTFFDFVDAFHCQPGSLNCGGGSMRGNHD